MLKVFPCTQKKCIRRIYLHSLLHSSFCRRGILFWYFLFCLSLCTIFLLILTWPTCEKVSAFLFLLHLINHHELQLRQIYQLANGGPASACTPLHTWISLITPLALPDYSQLCIELDCWLDCVFLWLSKLVRKRAEGEGLLTLDCTPLSGSRGTHFLQFQLYSVIETVSDSDTPHLQSHQRYHHTVIVPPLRFKKSLIKDRHCALCCKSK